MATKYLLFAHRKYWKDETALTAQYDRLCNFFDGECYLILSEEAICQIPFGAGDVAVAVLLSGSVQPLVLSAGEKFGPLVLYAGWVGGNIDDETSKLFVEYNAAPTTMDCWGVLRRNNRAVFALHPFELKRAIRVVGAYRKFISSKIILIGEIEPWVISNSRDLTAYERFGLTVEQVAQEELAQLYRRTTPQQAKPYYDFFKTRAVSIVEPSDADIVNSARMAHALISTMQNHKADGAAIACFNLLQEGTNCCLGVSYVNTMTDMCASCECDVDSLVTMLLMKGLTDTHLYMANPGILNNGVVNFNHCTAPVDAACCGNCDIILRSHHESGIGTSIQTSVPTGTTVTACRISAATRAATAHAGITVEGQYERACRTQCFVKFDDFEHYIATCLGCHQVFAFENIAAEFEAIVKLAGLSML